MNSKDIHRLQANKSVGGCFQPTAGRNTSHHRKAASKIPLKKFAFVPIKCFNVQVNMLIDTGASRSLCDQHFYNKLHTNIPIQTSCVDSFVVANKAQIKSLGMITLPIIIGTNELMLTFHIVEGLLYQLILGRDHMLQHRMTICYKENALFLEPYEEIFTASAVKIPPQSSIRVPMKLRSGVDKYAGFMTVTPNKKNPYSALLNFNHNLVYFKNGMGQVCFTNRGLTPIHVNMNEQLATATVIRPGYGDSNNVLRETDMTKPYVKKYRRTSHEYRQTIQQVDFPNSVLNKTQINLLQNLLWENRDVISVQNDLGCLKGYQYKINIVNPQPFRCAPYRLSPDGRIKLKEILDDFLDKKVIIHNTSDYDNPCLLVKKPGYQHLPLSQAKCRLVLDLRLLNDQSKSIKYSIPHIVEGITQLPPSRMKYMTSCDLASGFYQIALTRSSYRFVTFTAAGLGSYALTRLPQGFRGSPEIFQLIMESILPAELKEYIYVYLDDVLIATETFEHHLYILGKFFEVLSRREMTIEIKKSKFCQKNIQFLGHILTPDGIRPRDDKVKAIMQCPRPNTIRKLRMFLGSTGYLRRYVKNFSIRAKPLYDMLKKNMPFKWTKECQESWTDLKDALCKAPVLTNIDYNQKLILFTDACDTGLASTLYQLSSKDEKLKPIAYYSRTLNNHEIHYSTTEKEALAILSSIKHFSTYLRFTAFEIRSDHRPLKYLFQGTKKPQEQSRLHRWAMYLASFQFSIVFQKGDSNQMRNTDWLSRSSLPEISKEDKMKLMDITPSDLVQQEKNCTDCSPNKNVIYVLDKIDEITITNNQSLNEQPSETFKNEMDELPHNPDIEIKNEQQQPTKVISNYMIPYSKIYKKMEEFEHSGFPKNRMHDMQREDPFTAQIIKFLENNELPTETRLAKRIVMLSDQFLLDDSILFHIEIPCGGIAEEIFLIQLSVPSALQPHFLNEIHLPAHQGFYKMLQKIKNKFWWPKMTTSIQRYLDNCAICQADKRLRNKYKPSMRPSKTPTGPAQVWVLDHAGPIIEPNSKNSNDARYILICVDAYSLYVELIVTKTQSAYETAKHFFDRVIASHAFCEAIRHDKGKAFTNTILKHLTHGLGIKRFVGATMHPQTQGVTEKMVRTVSQCLRRIVNTNKGKWFHYIPALQLALNSTPSRVTQLTPYLLQYGRSPRDPLSLAFSYEKFQPTPHKLYLVELAKRVKIWKSVSARHRQKYREAMTKYYNKSSHIPDNLQPGELAYLFCPQIQTKYSGIRRLKIPYAGPFLILDILDNRLARLARLSDLTELDQLFAVDRLKLTNLGLDPPKYVPDEHLTPNEHQDVILQEREIFQPWDIDRIMIEPDVETDNDLVENETDNTNTGNDELKQNLTRELNSELIKEKIKPTKNIDSNITGETNNQDGLPSPLDAFVRIAPRVRTTRAGKQETVPKYRRIVKILATKIDRAEQILYKVLCQGSNYKDAFWASQISLTGKDIPRLIQAANKLEVRIKPKNAPVHLIGDN